MPVYVFSCRSCESEFSVDVPWSEKAKTRCPNCGGADLKEMFGRYTLNVLGPADLGGGSEPSCACGNPGGG